MGSVVTKLVFQPPEASYTRDPNLIWLHTAEREVIPAFFIDRDAKFTLLFSHGNAEDLGLIIGALRELSYILEVNVFAFEYSGYGMSTGEPREEAFYADIDAAYKYIRDIVGVPWHEVILYGRSIGSGPCTYLAAKTAVRALVLQSPVASIFRVALPSQVTLPGDMFTNVDRIGKVRCPIYFMHGTKDEIVPISHSEQLSAASQKSTEYPPYWVEDGGHNNLDSAREPFYDKFGQFLKFLETEDITDELQAQADSSAGL